VRVPTAIIFETSLSESAPRPGFQNLGQITNHILICRHLRRCANLHTLVDNLKRPKNKGKGAKKTPKWTAKQNDLPSCCTCRKHTELAFRGAPVEKLRMYLVLCGRFVSARTGSSSAPCASIRSREAGV